MKITSPFFYPNIPEPRNQSQEIRRNIRVIDNGMIEAPIRPPEILLIQEDRTPNGYHSFWTEHNSVPFRPPSETTDQKTHQFLKINPKPVQPHRRLLNYTNDVKL